jgi:hypothetical protein
MCCSPSIDLNGRLSPELPAGDTTRWPGFQEHLLFMRGGQRGTSVPRSAMAESQQPST